MNGEHSNECVNGFTLIELLIVITILGIFCSLLVPVCAKVRDKARTSVCQTHLKQLGLAATMYTQDYDEVMSPREASDTQWPALLLSYVRNSQIYLCPGDAKPYNPTEGDGTLYSDRVQACSYGMNVLKREKASWIGSGLWSSSKPVSGFLPGTSTSEGIPLAQVEAPSETILYCDVQDNLQPPHWEVTGIDAYSETDHGTARSGSGDIDVDGRHSGGFNAVFGDGHVKWIAFGDSRPQQWSIQQD